MITITAKVTGGAVFQQLKQLEDRILDLRPVLNKIPETILFPSVMRSFAAGGDLLGDSRGISHRRRWSRPG